MVYNRAWYQNLRSRQEALSFRMGFLPGVRLLFYSRFLYRLCDVVCSHMARLADGGVRLSGPRQAAKLSRLNQERTEHQARLDELGSSHMGACADCGGRCCHGPRERDTFIDRVLQNPQTPNRGARGPNRPVGSDHGRTYCPNLTPEGCTLPYKDRPIQCVTYFCRATVNTFSPEECAVGSDALARLMRIEIAVASEAVASRLRR